MTRPSIPFAKMNGLGNEIIVADMRNCDQKIGPDAAVNLAGEAATNFDQIMEIHDSVDKNVDADLRILNSDGSEAGACGNGMRCVISYLNGKNPKQQYLFRTIAGLLPASINADGSITVDMGSPRFDWQDIPLEEEFTDTTGIELQIGPIDDPVLHTPSVVNMGNPHAVFWVNRDVNSYDLERFGPMLENHPVFPDRANITIARIMARDHIIIRTWERGTGLTLACGSGACAALVCAVRKNLAERRATLSVPGGDLLIEWDDNNRVHMSGPVEYEFSGLLDPITGAFTLKTDAG